MLTTLRRAAVCAALGLALLEAAQASPADTERLQIDATAKGTPLPHFWEQMFGSGRAVLALRDDYRKDLDAVKSATGFGYIRFHGIFDRDMGVASRDAQGKLQFNFSYVDQVYDGLLERGVKPFVELGFMPPEMSADPASHHDFWYHPNVMPPKDWAEWDALVTAFTRHVIERYGIEEVSSWYFEVWNEPNLSFWGGKPEQSTYYDLYDRTARLLKAVNPRLRVGGPATAQAAWLPDFLKQMKQRGTPIDFVSTHVYGDDTADNVFKTDEKIARRDMVCRAVEKSHREIAASPFPRLPLVYSEYNASYANLPNVTDTVYMGPWMANTIRACAGKVELMSFWSFSDVFDEQGVVKNPFYGGFGLIAADRIPKPAFNAFALLHKLGDVRLPLNTENALATRRPDGTVVLALWNYTPPLGDTATYTPGTPTGPDKHFDVDLKHLKTGAQATLWRLDQEHGNAVAAFDKMGRPDWPSREQIAQLRKAGELAAPEQVTLDDGRLRVDVPAQGLVVVELR
jgi:xylan 1,4-beta-xylosidase